LSQSQRDLYVAVRDLLIRHDRLSIDQVERLKKRVETNSHRLDSVKATQRDGWQEEADKLVGLIERDQGSITMQLSRRVFIRAWLVYFSFLPVYCCYIDVADSMWHELRVVLHNRENTLLSVVVQKFAREELENAENVVNTWVSLQENVEGMPFE
jgi:sorting nexin-8